MSAGVCCLALDGDLLSHGETPHYHRRCIVSLLSSEWDQVVPMLYVRQAIRLGSGGVLPSVPEFGHVQSQFDVWGVALRFNEFSSFVCLLLIGLFTPNCLGVIWSSLTGN